MSNPRTEQATDANADHRMVPPEWRDADLPVATERDSVTRGGPSDVQSAWAAHTDALVALRQENPDGPLHGSRGHYDPVLKKVAHRTFGNIHEGGVAKGQWWNAGIQPGGLNGVQNTEHGNQIVHGPGKRPHLTADELLSLQGGP